MDNLTHSLVGAVLAEILFHQTSLAQSRKRAWPVRTVFWWVGFLGSNLADLDVLYAGGLVTPSALGSLLHHRGHTHTVVFALLEGFLLAFGAKKWLDRKRYIFPASDQWALSVLAFVSPLFHLFFDALNFYGVHPFWPFWNGWIFGDTFFICEPLLWIAFLPVVYFATDRRWVRSLIEAGFVALITVVWILPAARWYTAAVIGLFGWVQWRLHRRWPAEKRAAYCGFIALGVLACFAMASWWARWQIIRRNTELHPHAVLHDVVLSPFPANPLCWEVITVETFSDGTRYRLKRGKFSLLPGIAASHCPSFHEGGSTTAYLSAVPISWGNQFEWEGQYQTAVSDLKNYEEYSCAWSHFLQFARVPYLQEEDEVLWAGDLRFDHSGEIGFGELAVTEQPKICGGWFPPWIKPRQEIF